MSPDKNYPSGEVKRLELNTKVLQLMQDNKSYILNQVNGQRIYRKNPLFWTGPDPSRLSEIFIGRIPHDCYEDVLVPLFSQAGELFEFRLMVNFSGWNRGYAFAMYMTEGEAANAIRMFNDYMIRPSWKLGVCVSANNCRIFISRIPSTTSSVEIVEIVYSITEEVEEVHIRRSVMSCSAIVEYKSHRGAAMARKALVSAAAAAWGAGSRPSVDWSLPQSTHMLRQYREVGRWSLEGGVVITRASEEPSVPASPPSYTLEPWSQARRMRLIQDAQRAAALTAHTHTEWAKRATAEYLANGMFGPGPLSAVRPDSGIWSPTRGPLWSPPTSSTGSPTSSDYNPWTMQHPLDGAIPQPQPPHGNK